MTNRSVLVPEFCASLAVGFLGWSCAILAAVTVRVRLMATKMDLKKAADDLEAGRIPELLSLEYPMIWRLPALLRPRQRRSPQSSCNRHDTTRGVKKS